MSDTVRIYTVLDPSPLLAARDRLAGMFGGRTPDEKITFAMSQDGSRIWFSDSLVLWQSKNPLRLSANPRIAEIAARKFMARVNSAVQNDPTLRAAGFTTLFPDDCRLALNGLDPETSGTAMATQSVLVKNPDNALIDHWLVRFEAYLPTGGSPGSIPVYGANVDLRIGPDDAIAACSIRWRSCIPQGVLPLLAKPQNSDDQPDTSEDDNRVGPTLAYVMADEGTTQNYLAPYYFYPDGDDGYFAPATTYSLVAEMTDESSEDEIRVGCAVAGGSGDYEYRWFGWESTQAMGSLRDLSTLSHQSAWTEQSYALAG